jgi:hypothetical protein
VVTSHARVPISMLRPETIEFLSSADDRIGLARFPGQLWERVAEGKPVRRFTAITTTYGGNGVYDAATGQVAVAIVSREHAERIAGELEGGTRRDLYMWRPADPNEAVTS